jgi:hypothetical protein
LWCFSSQTRAEKHHLFSKPEIFIHQNGSNEVGIFLLSIKGEQLPLRKKFTLYLASEECFNPENEISELDFG